MLQREALGVESFLYMFMRIAGCEKIQQWGFDETTLDGKETINQWAMLVDEERVDQGFEGSTTVVTLECAGVLPCSLAENVVDQIETVWERGTHLTSVPKPHLITLSYSLLGKAAVEALREKLSPEMRDVLCPLRNGGVSLHKLYGVMHDTCNAANKVPLNPYPNPNPIANPNTLLYPQILTPYSTPQVARLMIDLRNRKCAQFYGEDVWAKADAKTKACFNFLCGNHTRNLPNVRFNKVSPCP